MRELRVVWQRLVDEQGRSCDRCDATGDAVAKAVELLREILAPLGIVVIAETRELDRTEFLRAPEESNRILIADRTLEEWLGAEIGRSRCCGPCEGEECRTVVLDGYSYEEIPCQLLVKAGLLAAARMLPLQRNPDIQTSPTTISPHSLRRSRGTINR